MELLLIAPWSYTKMFSESLFKIENGKQETMAVPYNKENTAKFIKALQILILKPQVVDRRILCGSVLQINVLPREAVLGSMIAKESNSIPLPEFDFEHEKQTPNFIPRLKNFPEKMDGIDVGGGHAFIQNKLGTINRRRLEQETSETALGSDDKTEGTEVVVVLLKVLPRQSDRMKPFHQLVLIDYCKNEAFFIRLDSDTVQLRIPEDLNQSWSYKVSLDVHSQEISITTSEYYEHHHPVKALPELTSPTQEWLFSTLLTKLCKWTKEIDPELPLQVKKSLISMERYSKVHALLKIKYADKFVNMWTESTDPQKYVYEDISIAAYLIVLWEEERERKNLVKKQSFVDLGCGNGLLVHILISEGVSAHATLLKNSAGQNSAFPT